VLDLSVDGDKPTPVVLKEAQRDPVRGADRARRPAAGPPRRGDPRVVPLELLGIDDAPGVKEGGVLEQITRELNVEALPTAIPEAIVHEVGEMQIGETIGCSARW
jgi:large subunit ribosomal protein L25